MSTQAAPPSIRFALVLGGARSGKSVYAERLTETLSAQRAYLATAEPFDGEMTERIERHRARRGAGWRTVEAPLDAPDALQRAAQPQEAILVDCLTLWLSNEMMRAEETASIDDGAEFAAPLGRRFTEVSVQISRAGSPIVAVSNEVGLGLVPETPLGRRFRDAQGRLNQVVAAEADLVVFVAAGLPLVLKGETPI